MYFSAYLVHNCGALCTKSAEAAFKLLPSSRKPGVRNREECKRQARARDSWRVRREARGQCTTSVVTAAVIEGDLRLLGSSEMRVRRVNLERYLRLRLRGRQGGVNAGI